MTSQPDSISRPHFSWKAYLLVFVCFLAVVVLLQSRAGAYHAEFGSEPDEAAHYVTGLFVHDYIKAGFPRHVREFADNYYNHYSKVALGHWGPTFYIVQAAWALLFTPDRASIMVLMAVLTALSALLLFHLLRKEFSPAIAFVGGMVFIAFPLVQHFFDAVMTEIPITLLVLLATLFFIRFLEHEKKRDSIGFGLCASLVILIKFSGLLLALVPPIAILLTRKWHLLKKPALWLAAIVVVVLAGPWSVKTVDIAKHGIAEEPFGWAFSHKAVPYYFEKLFVSAGIVVFVLALVGLIVKWPRKTHQHTSLWACAIALLFSVLIAAMIIPAGYEARHLIPALPAVVMFAVAGAEWFRAYLRKRIAFPKVACVIAFAVPLVLFGVLTFRIPHKGWSGFQDVAKWLNSTAKPNEKYLISSDARGEGMFIAEVAMHEVKRPTHYADRSSKKFADSDWSGSGYRLLFARNMIDKKEQKLEYSSADDLFKLLDQDTVTFFVLDEGLENPLKHHLMLREIIEKHPDRFVLERKFPLERSTKEFPNGKSYPEGILVYRFKHS